MFLRRGVTSVAFVALLALGACQKPAEPAATEPAPAAAAPAAATPAAAVAELGPVETSGTCGTIAGLKCKSSKDFCKTKVGQCGVADAEGVCTTKPEICPKDYRPVCSCPDAKGPGQTFGNACEADMAGKNVDYVGECKKPT